MDVGLISALVSVSGAVVAVAALVVNVADGRAGRRNTEFLGHRDMWWQRWSWVADRATSEDETQREAASVMATALVTRGWTTDDDTWVFEALERSRALQKTQRDEEGSPDDLHDE
ncbi:hypothetical protein DEJ28_01780 [Curtobacterium sp. MCPF17_002]|uniref:hypothetical protein n=1 Tax=Curtobacterium sp. MCPF17_002 TaxID=2175645 RepID=UPI0011B374C3|nr:hypothetical protein [Curtobacterium sp. MCPF17_002]WIB77851.1 hypothetical protein DEJ28_01780 [Curtobacterium sp. MCPF17_002]